MGSNIEVTEDMLAEHAEKWNRSLVGFFPGYRMNFFTVNKIASRVETSWVGSSDNNSLWVHYFPVSKGRSNA
uniref:Uncharacterized protein n=1 Tax=Salix viminalis TaxID=40686 RepID=A0A6N2KZ07_SALVM